MDGVWMYDFHCTTMKMHFTDWAVRISRVRTHVRTCSMWMLWLRRTPLSMTCLNSSFPLSFCVSSRTLRLPLHSDLPRNWVLDAVLVSFALACALGLWWSCRAKHAAERQMDHLLLNMKRAEEELSQLQAKLEYVENMGFSTHVPVWLSRVCCTTAHHCPMCHVMWL